LEFRGSKLSRSQYALLGQAPTVCQYKQKIVFPHWKSAETEILGDWPSTTLAEYSDMFDITAIIEVSISSIDLAGRCYMVPQHIQPSLDIEFGFPEVEE
jgi:hypothetical protein